MELDLLQHYWWLIIAVLGAALVFLLFVQGGQSMLYCKTDDISRNLMVNSLGRKWELTFTTLVVFGGAFFASFPLFYSTSFGGAYWLWMLILLSFVVQAVSYEFRRKQGNLYGTRTYDAFLMFNGFFGCVLLGVAVGMLFFGAEFTTLVRPSYQSGRRRADLKQSPIGAISFSDLQSSSLPALRHRSISSTISVTPSNSPHVSVDAHSSTASFSHCCLLHSSSFLRWPTAFEQQMAAHLPKCRIFSSQISAICGLLQSFWHSELLWYYMP